MQTIKTSAISTRFKSLFADLMDWNPTDDEYLIVPLDSLKQFIQLFPAPPFKQGVNECEEIARRFMCRVRDWELANGYELNQAIGVAFCTVHQGIEEPHTINIAYTDQGVYLFDMQTGECWSASDQDKIYFVEM